MENEVSRKYKQNRKIDAKKRIEMHWNKQMAFAT